MCVAPPSSSPRTTSRWSSVRRSEWSAWRRGASWRMRAGRPWSGESGRAGISLGAVAKAQTFWRSAVEGIRHQPFVHAVSTVTLAIALFTLGLARTAAHELDRLVGSLGGEVRVTVYLDPRAAPEARAVVATALRGRGMAVEEETPPAALEPLVRHHGPTPPSPPPPSPHHLPHLPQS